MAIDRNRKRTRLAMVVVRSPGVGEALLEDQRRIQMERQAGDSWQLVVRASPEEIRATQTATRRAAASSPSTRNLLATETHRRLLAHAHRARNVLAHRSVADHLSRTRRSELMSEVRRLKEEIQSLQDEIEVTSRSVESMELLAFHLQRLTRDFIPRNSNNQVRLIRDRLATQAEDRAAVLTRDATHSED